MESLMRCLLLVLLLTAAPARAVAQTAVNPDLLADWVRNRLAVLTYIDAMPDSATNFSPHEERPHLGRSVRPHREHEPRRRRHSVARAQGRAGPG